MSRDTELLDDFKRDMTEKEAKLIALLGRYPHAERDDDEICGIIYIISRAGRENGWTDEFIRICEANPDITFGELTRLIFTEERFPSLEIVDDEE